MVTKKGIALTAAIIGGFTAASFLVYFIPTGPQSQIILPADPASELVFAMERNEAIVKEFELTFEMWRNKELDRSQFDERTDAGVEQVDALMLELRGSNPPEVWVDSYFLYIQALENYKGYFEKTKEYVDHISGAGGDDQGQGELLQDSISQLRNDAEYLAEQSKAVMP